jgi:hypothetical protein
MPVNAEQLARNRDNFAEQIEERSDNSGPSINLAAKALPAAGGAVMTNGNKNFERGSGDRRWL